MKKFTQICLFVILIATVLGYPTPHPIFDEAVDVWWEDIVDICAEEYDLDPYFVAGIVKQESWFDKNAVNAGEQQAYESGHPGWYEKYFGKGLTQVTGPWIAGTPYPRAEEWQYNMPEEATYEEAPRMDDPFHGRQNLRRGCWYLSTLMKRYDDEYKVATAYRYGFFGVDDARFDAYDNDYVNNVMKYKEDYVENSGYKPHQKEDDEDSNDIVSSESSLTEPPQDNQEDRNTKKVEITKTPTPDDFNTHKKEQDAKQRTNEHDEVLQREHQHPTTEEINAAFQETQTYPWYVYALIAVAIVSILITTGRLCYGVLLRFR